MAKEKTLEDLFHDTLKDIYYAERKILKALPKMARAASSPDLKAAFEKHKDETEGHVERLQQVFELMGKRPQGKTCAGDRRHPRRGRGNHRRVQGHAGPRRRPDLRGPGGRALRDHTLRHAEALGRSARHERCRRAARANARRGVHDGRGADRLGGCIRQRDGQGRLIQHSHPPTIGWLFQFAFLLSTGDHHGSRHSALASRHSNTDHHPPRSVHAIGGHHGINPSRRQTSPPQWNPPPRQSVGVRSLPALSLPQPLPLSSCCWAPASG